MAEKILIVLLVLLPTAFSRWTEDAWDFPKGALLTTGGLLLAGWGLAGELAAFQRLGPGKWWVAARSRFISLMRRDLLGAAMMLFLVSSGISTILSPNPKLALFGVQGSHSGFLVACATTAVYFTARSFLGGVASFDRLARATAIAAAIASGYGLLQFSGHDPFKWGLMAYVGGKPRIPGTMGQPNLLAAVLMMALPLIAWLVGRSKSAVGRLGWSAVGVSSLAAIGATLSRASWLAVGACAVGGGLLYLKAKPSRDGAPGARRMALVATAALVVAVLAGAFVMTRTSFGSRILTRVHEIASLKENANLSRIQNWRAGLKMAAWKPVFGIGTDQYGLEFPAYRTPLYYRLEAGSVPVTAHNVAINTLVNQGAFGALAALLIFIFAIGATWRALHHPDPAVRMATVAAAAGLAGFLLWDLANYTVAALGALSAALVGWISGAAETSAAMARAATSTGSAIPRPRNIARPAWAVIAVGILVVVAFIPFVLHPWLAQMGELTGFAKPVKSRAHFEALTRASTLAPWDGRHEHRLAASFLTVASTPGDSTRSMALLLQGRAAEERAIKAEPRNGLFYAGYGSILMQLAKRHVAGVQVTDVRNAFNQALRRDPSNPDIINTAAQDLVSLAEYPEAAALALRCAHFYPELADPLATLGLIALRQGRYQGAADTLELSLTRDWAGDVGDKARALTNLSGAYLGLRRFEQARVTADEALKIDPSLEAAVKNRAVAVQWLAMKAVPPK